MSNMNNSDVGNYSFSVRAYDLIGGSTDFASVDLTLNITENQSPTFTSLSNYASYTYKDM